MVPCGRADEAGRAWYVRRWHVADCCLLRVWCGNQSLDKITEPKGVREAEMLPWGSPAVRAERPTPRGSRTRTPVRCLQATWRFGAVRLNSFALQTSCRAAAAAATSSRLAALIVL